jgi:hypothetical protein
MRYDRTQEQIDQLEATYRQGQGERAKTKPGTEAMQILETKQAARDKRIRMLRSMQKQRSKWN